MREKLIELLKRIDGVCPTEGDCEGCKLQNLVECYFISKADFLIANGVIVLPCKIGDDIWWVNDETKSVECEKNGVAGFMIKRNEVLILDKAGCEDRIGSQYCNLSKEDAEKALATLEERKKK